MLESTTLSVTHVAEELLRLPSVERRATRSLELLLQASGARQGFLFILRGRDLVLGARIADDDLPPRMETQAWAVVDAALGEDDTTGESSAETRSAWLGSQGREYHQVLIARNEGGKFVVVALAILIAEEDRAWSYPFEIVGEVARVGFASFDQALATPP